MATNDEIIKLILDIQKTANVENAREELDKLINKLDQADKATEKLNKQQGNLGYGLLTAGRAIQDFAQGGVGGVLNNIEGLVTALGGTAGLAGVLTAVGVAAFIAGPLLKEFFFGIDEKGKDAKSAADNIKKMTEEIHEMNRQTKEEIELEKQLKQAKADRAAVEKMAGIGPPGEAEASQARAAELQAGFGGQQAAIAGAMETTLDSAIQQEQTRFNRERPFTAAWYSSFRNLQRLEALKKQGGGAMLLGRAMIGGKEADVRAAIEMLPRGAARRGFEEVLPEPVAAAEAEDAAFTAKMQAATNARIRRQEAAKKQKEVDRRSDDEARKFDHALAATEHAKEEQERETIQRSHKAFRQFTRRGPERRALERLQDTQLEAELKRAETMHWVTAAQAKAQRGLIMNREIQRRQLEIQNAQSVMGQ